MINDELIKMFHDLIMELKTLFYNVRSISSLFQKKKKKSNKNWKRKLQRFNKKKKKNLYFSFSILSLKLNNCEITRRCSNGQGNRRNHYLIGNSNFKRRKTILVLFSKLFFFLLFSFFFSFFSPFFFHLPSILLSSTATIAQQVAMVDNMYPPLSLSVLSPLLFLSFSKQPPSLFYSLSTCSFPFPISSLLHNFPTLCITMRPFLETSERGEEREMREES